MYNFSKIIPKYVPIMKHQVGKRMIGLTALTAQYVSLSQSHAVSQKQKPIIYDQLTNNFGTSSYSGASRQSKRLKDGTFGKSFHDENSEYNYIDEKKMMKI